VFWRRWSDRCASAGPWTDVVKRSLVVLKGLTYAATGGIVAAPTTSLPEQLGGVRNWDYRYCWLRDATFTLLALMHAGYYDEAQTWRDWLFRAVAGSPDQLQIMYGLGGERRLTEWEVPWLPGFEGSRPVRIGNAAVNQTQLDIYGEVLDALYHAHSHGLPPNQHGDAIGRVVLRHLAKIWDQPDEGIWEVRGPPQHFTHSKVMVWVAFDRMVKMLEQRGNTGRALPRWRQVRDRIHEDVCGKAFDRDLGSFVQAYGSKALDASLLLLPLVGFLPPSDPRIVGTVRTIEERLMADGFVCRYDTGAGADGLPPGEGAFLACSFWLADNFILQGRIAEARELFERLLALRNDVGLLAEEYDPRLGRQLGNFPQAFSHVALVNTAFNLTRRKDQPSNAPLTVAEDIPTGFEAPGTPWGVPERYRYLPVAAGHVFDLRRPARATPWVRVSVVFALAATGMTDWIRPPKSQPSSVQPVRADRAAGQNLVLNIGGRAGHAVLDHLRRAGEEAVAVRVVGDPQDFVRPDILGEHL